jgi:kexin
VWSIGRPSIQDNERNNIANVICRGESGIGKWTLVVKDTEVNDNNGTFIDWHLKLWGEAIDPKLTKPLPMPEESDDDNHNDIIATTTISATHTSVAVISTDSSMAGNPTNHPDRPVNAKPTGTPEVSPVESSKPTGTPEEEVSPAESSAPAATTSPSSGWLPSSFPTFGLSPHTQIWVYGSVGLIVVFCCGLGVYFYMARRKRLLNNPRDDYEFDVLQDEEAEGLTGNGDGKGRKSKRRAGELYDAFAAGSEDEEEEFSDAEEGVEKQYTDQEHHVIGDDDDDSDTAGNEKPSDRLVAK